MNKNENIILSIILFLFCIFLLIIIAIMSDNSTQIYKNYCGSLNMRYVKIHEERCCFDKGEYKCPEWMNNNYFIGIE